MTEEIKAAEASIDTGPKLGRPPKPKLFPVRLLKGYRPIGNFLVETADDQRDPTEVETLKVSAGAIIHLNVDEARDIISKRIAERNDAIA